MLLESFKANVDDGYVIVPGIVPHSGYISYDFKGMTPDEINAWKFAVTIPQVRRARPATAEDYLSVLQGLGVRAALAGTDASHAIREEYNVKPLSRRMK